MRTILSTVLVAALVTFPAAFAGDASNPEIQDAPNDVGPASLDVTAAWLTTVGTTWSGRDDQTVKLTIKLRDLSLPAIDDDADDTRYYYVISFTPSTGTQALTFVCYINLVDTSPLNQAVLGEYGAGTDCREPTDEHLAALLAARPEVDLLGDTVSVTFSRPFTAGVPMPPGTVLEDIVIKTASGPASSTFTPLFQGGNGNRGPTLDDTFPGVYQI